MAIVNGPIQHDRSTIAAPKHVCGNCGSLMLGYRWADKPNRCTWDCESCGAESIHSLPLPKATSL